MKPTRLSLGIALVVMGLLGIYWAVCAQDRGPLFAPPSVLPTDGVDKKSAAKYPYQAQSLKDKKKSDPTLIVPAEVYEVPRPIRSDVEEPKRGVLGVVQMEGDGPLPLPPPTFPPTPTGPVLPTPMSEMPQPLPILDTKPIPMPILEPTKVLIIEPVVKEAPPKKATPNEAPLPTVVIPPPAVIPEVKAAPPAPTTINMPTVAPPAPARSRAFVRIKPAVIETPSPFVDKLGPDPLVLAGQNKLSIPPPPIAASAGPADLMNLQTPGVTVEKRDALRRDPQWSAFGDTGMIEAGETRTYQLVIRNRGPVPAQQIRIEDELPPNARIVSAAPTPVIEGNKAQWLLSNLGVNQEQILQITLQATSNQKLKGRTSVQVGASSETITTALRPRNDAASMAIQLTGPNSVSVGKSAVFEVRVVNQSSQPLTGLTLFGALPEGMVMKVKDDAGTRDEREIKGEIDETIQPGESKILKMPASAVKAGRWTVAVKVTAQGGFEASATTSIEIAGQTLHLHQAPATRMFIGRDGDLRVELTNHTSKPLRNVAVADRLPEGLDFIEASERGLYQANSRTVYWLIDQMPAGKTQTLVVRVNGAKAGQHQNVVFAKADGVAEMQCTGVVALDGVADLTMRVVDRDPIIEQGKETVYEIRVHNPGNAPVSNVQLQGHFPPGMTPRNAQANAKVTVDANGVVFEPIAALEPNGEAIFRVTAMAQAMGDQRVRFAVVSDQVRTPVQREISTRVVER